MALIVNRAPRIISLNGGEHNGRHPGGVTMLPNGAAVITSAELDEILRADTAFLGLIASGQVGDLENAFGVTQSAAKSKAPSTPAADPAIVSSKMTVGEALGKVTAIPDAPVLPTTQKDLVPPAPTVVEDAPAEETDPFDGFAQAITPEEFAKLPADQAVTHIDAADNLDTLKAFWTADMRPDVRKLITTRAQALKNPAPTA